MVSLLVVSSLVVAGPAPTVVAQPAAGPQSLADGFADRYLSVRPSIGPTVVVDAAGLSLGGRRLLSSLQGLVNRSSARMFVLQHPTDNGWIDWYEEQDLVEVVGRTDLLGALDGFAADASGYYLVDEAEPWTINVGTSLASLSGALIATPEYETELTDRGLSMIEDLRGRWGDGTSAYIDLITNLGDGLPYEGAAVLRPSDLLYDFAYQQGMAIVFTRPSQPDWPTISSLITSYPSDKAVYGYLSDTGNEESAAVQVLSAAGKLLMPTDTTSNLSFHLAVGADRPRAVAAAPDTGSVAPCRAADVNVVVAISDGDNLALGTKVYRDPGHWDSPARGSIPLGWSTTPTLALLAPAVWDFYVETASPRDELVPVIGRAYGAADRLPDAATFYRESFDWNAELGMGGFWSFAAGTALPSSPQTTLIDEVAAASGPNWLLVDYDLILGLVSGAAPASRTPGGLPKFIAQGLYDDDPEAFAGRVRTLLETDPAERPLVTFYSAAVWRNTVEGLADALLPLEAEGVRFLTPSEAAACVEGQLVVDPGSPGGGGTGAVTPVVRPTFTG